MNREWIGVAGLGFLGRGIAACLLAHGFRVIGYTVGEHTQERARDYITKAIDELVTRANFPSSLRTDWQERYHAAESLAEFSRCGFVIESVLEDFDVKQNVFDQIEAVVDPSVPIGSNTSAIPITLLQSRRKHPARFLGMHWTEPAYATRFLELIRGAETSDEALTAAMAIAQRTGKEPSLVQQDVPAFIVNRLGYAMYREALHLLELGVGDAETIDRAFRNGCGLWASFCGPLRWIDITGGPSLYAKAMQRVLPTLSNASELPKTLQEKWANGERGVINGKGFYSYAPGDAAKWEAMLHEHAWEVWHMQQRNHPLPDVSGDADAVSGAGDDA